MKAIRPQCGWRVNILDLVPVAKAIGESDSEADFNSDGVVNILDLV